MTAVFEPQTMPVVYDAATGQPTPMADAIHNDGIWWTCPPGCDPDLCDGGEVFTFPDVTFVMPRMHKAVPYAAVTTHADHLTLPVNVELAVRQAEDDDTGLSDREIVLTVAGIPVTVTPTMAAALAAALAEL
jgi:hypothetical protein